jgi:hypothetical protein
MASGSSPLIVANNQFDKFRAVLVSPEEQVSLNPPRWTRWRSMKPTGFIR